MPDRNPQNQGMHPADIVAELKKRKLTVTAIASALNCSHNSVRLVINNKQQSKRIAEYVAEKIGKTADELWPGQYSYEGRKPFRETLRNKAAA